MEKISAHISVNGFEGILYPVKNRKDKVMIVISGSNGGLNMTKQCAEFYAENGIPSLALALSPSGTFCWSYQGQEIPFAQYKSRNFNIPKIILKEREWNLLDINKDKDVTSENIIPVEKINGAVR